jgi:MFS family permease
MRASMSVSQGRASDRSIVRTLVLLPFCFSFTQMSVPTMLPSFDREFGASATWSSWTFSVFMLFATVTLPLIGRLADQYGRRRMLLVTGTCFVVGSIGCAAAPGLVTLIAFRALQGSAASFVALTLTLVADVIEPRRQSAAVGAIVVGLGAGNVVATIVAPVLADVASWRVVFVLVALLSTAALVLIARRVPDAGTRTPARFDVAGATLLAIAIAALMLGLTEGGAWGWASPTTVAVFATSIAAAAAWTVVELRVSEPMVELRMLAEAAIARTNAASIGLGFACFTSIAIVSRLAAAPNGVPPEIAATIHHGFAAPTAQIGLYLLPGCLAGTLTGAMLGRLTARVGWKWPLVGGTVLLAAGLGILAAWHSSAWGVVLVMTLVGIPTVSTATITAKIVADRVRAPQRGVATTLNAVAFQAGGAIGVQVIAAILAGSVVAGTNVPSDAAFSGAFAAAAVAAALAVPLALGLPGRMRSEPSATLDPVAVPL